MIKKEMSEAQHLAFDLFEEREQKFLLEKQRFLNACLAESGVDMSRRWRFEPNGRFFWTDEPNASPFSNLPDQPAAE